MTAKPHYLVNPAAGGGRAGARWSALRSQLVALGLEGPSTESTQPGHLRRLAEDLARDGRHPVLVAVGGDGAVLEVASGLRSAAGECPVLPALAILPVGSGNDAARMAGIADPASGVLALTGMPHGQAESVDVVEVECRADDGITTVRCAALVFAGAGLAADIIRATPPRWKRLLGARLGYIAGFFRALVRHRPYPMELAQDAEPHRGHFAAVVAANHTHAGGHTMHIGPGADPRDGAFDLSIIEGVGRWAVARQFLRLLRGTHVRHPAVRYVRSRELGLRSSHPVPIQADGEYLGTTPAVFRIVPRGLRLITRGTPTRW